MTTPVTSQAPTSDEWSRLSLMAQLSRVGDEVSAALTSKATKDVDATWVALERALDLFDLTIADERWRGPRRREICRAREVVCDFVVGANEYGSTADFLVGYFAFYANAARSEEPAEQGMDQRRQCG